MSRPFDGCRRLPRRTHAPSGRGRRTRSAPRLVRRKQGAPRSRPLLCFQDSCCCASRTAAVMLRCGAVRCCARLLRWLPSSRSESRVDVGQNNGRARSVGRFGRLGWWRCPWLWPGGWCGWCGVVVWVAAGGSVGAGVCRLLQYFSTPNARVGKPGGRLVVCEAFFGWQPMEASQPRMTPADTGPSLQGGDEPVWALFVPPPCSGAVSTQLRSARAATDGSRWQLRSRGGAGEASAEECKGTLGCPQQCASETGVWC